MIIAGPCLMYDKSDNDWVIETALQCAEAGFDMFRCKLWGGGTSKEKWFDGVGQDGIKILYDIDNIIIPAGTEVRTPEEFAMCKNLSFVWVGARNCQNYSLMKSMAKSEQTVLIKRGQWLGVDSAIKMYQCWKEMLPNAKVYLCERGTIGIDRPDGSRFALSLNDILMIAEKIGKENLFVDISHAVEDAQYIEASYKSLKAIGIDNFMFECYNDISKTKTDVKQAVSVQRLKEIVRG
jgi:3-deoxy-7-phosphoheptulonate synthase